MEMERPSYDLLIVSDLHLSEGREAKTKRLSRNEDFFFDEEFARFLAHHSDQTRWPDRRWHLIINGDFLDFLQVVSTDLDQEYLEYLNVKTREEGLKLLSLDREKAQYGFGSGPRETVFKLWKIMDGHWQFFEALASFVADGHVVTIGRGNHDVELFYPEVREAFVPKLRRIYADQLMRKKDSLADQKLSRFDAACRENGIRFMDWFYYEKGLLWVEHGNQYDSANCFKYGLAPLMPAIPDWDPNRKEDIDLPWGSFFVRYLFNLVEKDEPFADNIKPQTKFIFWFVTHHPSLALQFLFGPGRYMLSKMRRAWQSLEPQAYKQRERDHLGTLQRLAAESGISPQSLQAIDCLRAPNVLKEHPGSSGWCFVRFLVRYRLVLPLVAVGVAVVTFLAMFAIWCGLRNCFPEIVREIPAMVASCLRIEALKAGVVLFLKWLLVFAVLGVSIGFIRWLFARKANPVSDLALRARKIQELLHVQYVTMGHTHDTDLQSLDGGGEYFNTGTWTKVFSEEERLVREESELVFLRGIRQADRLSMKLLKWNDAAGEPRLVKLFQ